MSAINVKVSKGDASIIADVKRHVSGQRKSGAETLAMFVRCVDHFSGESGDWSPLALLIGASEPAQSRMCRSLAGKCIMGWTIAKDTTQASGLRFKKVKGANQGFDTVMLDKLRPHVGKASIQSDVVKAFVKKPTAEEEKEFDVVAWGKRTAKGHTMSELDHMIAELQKAKSALGTVKPAAA